MSPAQMHLKILLPFQVFGEAHAVSRIVVETQDGAYGLLPHRLDCAAALTPGILIYETDAGEEVCIAVDQGILVKTGLGVLVSVRSAIAGTDLSQLRAAVEREFLTIDEQERSVRTVMARLESGFLHRVVRFEHG